MIPIRYTCADCSITFDLALAPLQEWPEEVCDASEDADIDVQAMFCPYCGSGRLKAASDPATIVKR